MNKNIRQIVDVKTDAHGNKTSVTRYAALDTGKPYPNGGRGKMKGLKAVDSN